MREDDCRSGREARDICAAHLCSISCELKIQLLLEAELKDEKRTKEKIIETIMIDDALRHSCRGSEVAFWVWTLAVSATKFSRTKTYNFREHRLTITHI